MLKKYRNIISILLLFGLSLIIYGFYHYAVKFSIDPIRLPVANSYLASGHKITLEDVTYIEVPKSIVIDNIYKDSEDIIGKYINSYNSLAKGSIFYQELLTKTDEIKDSNSYSLLEGEVAIPIEVNKNNSYANSILKGQTIDIYFQGFAELKEEDKVLYGLLVKNARVLAVYDSDGKVVDQTNQSDAEVIVVALDYSDSELVQKAKFFGDVILIVSYDTLNNTENTYYDLALMRDIINQRSIDISLNKDSGYE